MARPSGFRGRVVAVDWSGARDAAGQRRGICVATASARGLEWSAGHTRVETIEMVERLPGPVVVGFDFSFGLPAWFAAEHGCTAIDDVWALAARAGERWLRPEPPFWRERCRVPADRRLRRCEERLPPAKSVFQLVGAGQVGAGSVRGMPLLARLRASGFAVWPFDAAGARTALEIYPSRLRRFVPRGFDQLAFESPHARDAAASACVMWEHRDSFADLAAATDPVTRIEGDVWMPAEAGAVSRSWRGSPR